MRRRALVFVTVVSLLAFIANALAFQTHEHFDKRPAGIARHATSGSVQQIAMLAVEEHCAICDAASFTGAYVPPPEAAFARRLSTRFVAHFHIASSLLLATRSHDWHSRAPPGTRPT